MLNSNMAMKIVYGLKIFVDHTLKLENFSKIEPFRAWELLNVFIQVLVLENIFLASEQKESF